MPMAASELEIEVLQVGGRRLQDHLELVIVLQPVGVLAVAAVLGPARGLHIGRVPRLRAERAQRRRRVEGAGADLHVVGLQDDAALLAQKRCSVRIRPWKERDRDKIKSWGDLSGKRVFTGPPPWDVRAHLERAMAAAGVKHDYVQIDLQTVAQQLEAGQLSGFIIYTSAETGTAPWITETSLGTDWAALNPSAAELETLKKAGFATFEATEKTFKHNIHTDKVTLFPFYYGFHVGMKIPEDDVYRMLVTIEKNIDELAKIDPGSFAQLQASMPEMQRRGVASSVEFVRVHPGLARYMRERKVWDSAWDDRVASATN
jgi:hypothetical protein